MTTNERIGLKFSTSQIERTIIALINNGYNKKFASNVGRLFDMFDPASYLNDYDKEVRVYIVKKVADIICKQDIKNKEAILSFLDIDGKYYSDCINILNTLFDVDLPESEIASIDKLVSDTLRYSIVEKRANDLSELLQDFESETYDNFDDHITKLTECVDTVGKELRSAKESINDSKNDVNLSDSSFLQTMTKIIDKEKNPDSKIKLGIQMLNSMFDGGLEKGRVYCAFGVAKGWKSGFLLTSAIAAKKYNSSFSVKPGMKPVILYLTMENSIEETIKRIWAHAFGNSVDIKDYDGATALAMLENAKIFTPNNPNSAELLLKYRANKSINTSDLNGILDDLEKNGQQCVLLVLDYLKRIRSVYPNKEIRLELSQITDELSTLAKDRDIPILTAQQLNRDAFRGLEEAPTFESKISAIERLGASNIGESIDIIQNVDYGFILNKVNNVSRDENGEIAFSETFLTFKLIAARGRQPKITSFMHRFKDDNEMALFDDIGLDRSYSTTIENLVKDRVSNNTGKSTGARRIAG